MNRNKNGNTPPNKGLTKEQEQDIERWIQGRIDGDCIKFMDDFGFLLCDKKAKTDRFPGYNAMSTSQIRNIYSEVKRIEGIIMGQDGNTKKKDGSIPDDALSLFFMLLPKMAYNAAREVNKRRHSTIKNFQEWFDIAHLAVDGKVENFFRFSQFLEGIIAYHKAYGGK